MYTPTQTVGNQGWSNMYFKLEAAFRIRIHFMNRNSERSMLHFSFRYGPVLYTFVCVGIWNEYESISAWWTSKLQMISAEKKLLSPTLLYSKRKENTHKYVRMPQHYLFIDTLLMKHNMCTGDIPAWMIILYDYIACSSYFQQLWNCSFFISTWINTENWVEEYIYKINSATSKTFILSKFMEDDNKKTVSAR